MLGHVLFALLLIAMPLQGWVGMQRLRSGAVPPPERQQLYMSGVAVQGFLSVLAVAAWLNLPTTVRTPLPFPIGTPTNAALAALLAGVGIWLLLPFLPSPWQAAQRTKTQKSLRPITFLLPVTPQERQLWWLVSLSAGLTEEWLYRAFMPAYLQASPWHLRDATTLLIVSSLVFGLAHSYQGIKGILITALLGVTLGVAYLWSGSLLVPMMLHALIDLRILLLWPPDSRAAGTTE